MFIDEANIKVISGKGGDGIIHFRREKFVPRGGPDGGDGGRGGNVVLDVSTHLNTLYKFRNQQEYHAEDGARGGGSNMTGKSGKDLVIKVPPGTLVYDDETDQLLGDLIKDGQKLVVAKGGRGGRGNSHFSSSKNKAPRIAEKGEPAEERILRLELKLIADIAIVGVPNAGKSTFLSVVSNAKPKIAPYPFTTIQPNLGIASIGPDQQLVLADIPGLIEGAHQGIGLGHDFLRHIQRTRVLIHLLDGLSEDPLVDFAQINSELALFDESLAEKPQIVVFNKIDLPEVRDLWSEYKKIFAQRGHEVIAISAATGENVQDVLYQAWQKLESLPEPEPQPEEMPVYRSEVDPNAFEIEKLPDGWRIRGKAIERAAAMTYWEYGQSRRRFQKILETIGIDSALIEAGVENGDSIYIGDFELEWQD